MNTNKSLFFALLTLVLLVNIAFGQEVEKTDSSKFAIGVNIGPSGVTWLGNMTDVKNTLRLSYMAGVSLQYRLTKKISLNAGLNYENKGSYSTYNPGSQNSATGIDRINYIVLPVTAKFQLKSYRSSSFYANVGGYVAYNASNRQTATLNEQGVSYKISGARDDLNSFDLGLVTGLGVTKKVTKKLNFSIELRNNLGLAEIFKQSTIVFPPSFNVPTLTKKAGNESVALIFGLSYTL